MAQPQAVSSLILQRCYIRFKGFYIFFTQQRRSLISNEANFLKGSLYGIYDCRTDRRRGSSLFDLRPF